MHGLVYRRLPTGQHLGSKRGLPSVPTLVSASEMGGAAQARWKPEKPIRVSTLCSAVAYCRKGNDVEADAVAPADKHACGQNASSKRSTMRAVRFEGM